MNHAAIIFATTTVVLCIFILWFGAFFDNRMRELRRQLRAMTANRDELLPAAERLAALQKLHYKPLQDHMLNHGHVPTAPRSLNEYMDRQPSGLARIKQSIAGPQPVVSPACSALIPGAASIGPLLPEPLSYDKTYRPPAEPKGSGLAAAAEKLLHKRRASVKSKAKK